MEHLTVFIGTSHQTASLPSAPCPSVTAQLEANGEEMGLTKKKRKRAQINKIRNERADITADSTEIQRLRRDDYEQLNARKFDSLEEMDEFLEFQDWIMHK